MVLVFDVDGVPENAVGDTLSDLDLRLARLAAEPDVVHFAKSPARLRFDRLRAAKARLLVRLGRKREAYALVELLRGSYASELDALVVEPDFLEWRWIRGSNTPLPASWEGIDAIRWEALASYSPVQSAQIPYLLRALGGDVSSVASRALDILVDEIAHQGSTYEVTAPVIRWLVTMLARDVIRIPRLANRVREEIAVPWLAGFLPESERPVLPADPP